MSVIIRLQNLAWSANALDIRQFFRGLSIPEGGVHIVGGELGDAFIAFSTDEDARQAMMHDGGKIKEMKIKLLLSSRTEMQKVIETARQQTLSLQSFMQTSAVGVSSSSQVVAAQQVLHQQQQSQQQQQHRLSSPVFDSKTTVPKRDRDRDTDNDSSSNKDRKERRNRSRSRSRGRDRSSGGGGRDYRRRRDRSRSRNRDRDRRDRGRRNRRDYSRSRSRSRDRDGSKRSLGTDRRKDSQHDNDNDSSDVVCVGQFSKDKVTMPGIKNIKVNSGLENGIWEIPPQTQMQQAAAMMIAPGILGAGLTAAISQNSESRSIMRFGGNNAAAVQPTPLLQSNFSLNNLNNGLQPHNINPLLNSISSANLTNNLGISPINLGSLPTRQNWSTGGSIGGSSNTGVGVTNSGNNNNDHSASRINSDARFPSRTGVFLSSDMNVGFNSNSPYRSNPRFNNQLPINNKTQEFDLRRNIHSSFQSTSTGNHNLNSNSDHSKTLPSRCYSSNSNNNNKQNNIDRHINTQTIEGDKNSGYCIEVRNMPLNATYGDVRHAFQGIYIKKDGIKLINDTHGNRVGIAYIKFSKIDGKELALSVPRYVRGSEVEVCPLEDSIFDKAVDSYIPIEQNRGNDRTVASDLGEEGLRSDDINEDSQHSLSKPSSCILIADLPSFTKEMDIAKLFQDWKINDLFISHNKNDDRNNGYACKAYVQFDKVEDALASTKLMNLKIGSKPIMAVTIPEDIFIQEKKIYEESLDNNLSLNNKILDACISMKDLPFHTIDRDVLDFFSDIGIVPKKIHIISNKQATPMHCDAFCEFNTHEEAVRAVTKNGVLFGKNVSVIKFISRSEMMDILNNDHSDPDKFVDSQHMFSSLPNFHDRSKLFTQIGQSHHHNSHHNHQQHHHHQQQHNNNNNNNNSNNNSNRHQQYHPSNILPPLTSLHHHHIPRFGNSPFGGGNSGPPPRGGLHGLMNFPRPPLGIMNTSGNGNNSGSNNNTNNNNNNRSSSIDHVEGFGKPGCVLSLENVPFKADINEIIDFFRDFDIKRENVIRRYNDRGMPTGDARVAFPSPSEAQRALRELRNHKVRDRTIYMKLV
ncbi:hybrid signal transduction histidine kinase A [Chelonus insularis]|uniref:hybrid signal transduction histidine kinase A n=1 Tax=Chelonus insularis TaxID=460826 RepID=UPI00158CF7B5|nr:hybrid signal transduction histidine kinase A [Chelonus insularis]